MRHILQVLPKLNIYINKPTPFAGPLKQNTKKPDPPNPTEMKESTPRPKRTAGNPFGRNNAPTQKIQPETS